MLNFSKLLLILSPLLLISCSVNSSNDQSDSIINDADISASKKNKISLDDIIKCNGDNIFSFSGDYFYYPDYGCIYNEKNKIGDVQVFLFPRNKKEVLKSGGAYGSIEDYVNSMNVDDIKNNFYIFIRVIDKSDLIFADGLDSPYYLKENPRKSIYYFDNKWKNIDIDIDIDDNTYLFYRKVMKDIKKNDFDKVEDATEVSREIYSNQLNGEYDFDTKNYNRYDDRNMEVIFKEEADLDMDGEKEIISVTKPKGQDVRNFDVIINIYQKINGKTHLWRKNNLMFKDPVNGCMMDGLDEITLKPGGFDVEYTSCYDNNYVNRFVSFSYKSKADDFEVTENKILFFNAKSDNVSEDIICSSEQYLFSNYNGSCELK